MAHSRPYWPPLDDPKAVSFDVAERLKAAGYPQTLARVGYAQHPEGYPHLVPIADAEVAAPSASHLLAYYLDSGLFTCVTTFARREDYMALDESVDARAATLDDAVGELALKKLAK